MLKLIHIATNTAFQLPATLRIPFTLNSPIFAESGSQTFSATISARSAINRRLTGYQHRPGKPDNSGTLIPVFLELNGQRKRCTMNIIEADADDIKFNLYLDEGSFIVAHGDKLLSEVHKSITLYDLIPIPFTSGNEYHTKKYPEINVAYPLLKNTNYYDGTIYEEDWNANGACVNLPDNLKTIAGDYYVICPQLFLLDVIKKTYNFFGYQIIENFLDQEGLDQLLILNMVDTAIVNIFFDNGIPFQVPTTRALYYPYKHLPSKTIKDFFKSLLGRFNTYPIINETNKTVRLVNLDNVLSKPIKADLSDRFSNIKLKDVPDYTGYEFTMTGEIPPNVTENIVNRNDISNKLVLPEITEADLLDGNYKLNGIYMVNTGTDLGYKFYQLIKDELGDITWKTIGYDGLGDIFEGTSVNPIKFETNFTYAFNYGVLSLSGEESQLIQRYDRQGISELIEYNGDKDFGMVLAFYIPVNEENIIPRTRWFYTNGDVKFSLIPGSENGPVQKFFPKTLNMMLNRRRVYESDVNFSSSDIIDVVWDEKYHIHGGTFMLKSIKGYLNLDGSIDYDKAELVEV
jgi:hypothetical protein